MDGYNDIYEEDPFERYIPYEDNIEVIMLAWQRLADAYHQEVHDLSKDLYDQLGKIKCNQILTNQLTRMSKT